MEQSPLADVFDAHVTHEFVDKNVDATMQTMTAEPYLLHLPTLEDLSHDCADDLSASRRP